MFTEGEMKRNMKENSVIMGDLPVYERETKSGVVG